MKKRIGFFLVTGLLLTGCSSNSDDMKNDIANNANQSNIESTEVSKNDFKSLKGYEEAANYLEKNNKNLIDALKKLNIEYKSSFNNNFIRSKGDTYTKYDTKYEQSLYYNSYADYQKKELKTTFIVEKAYHIEDEFDLSDPYVQLIYKALKLQDKTYSEKKFKAKINELRGSDTGIRYSIFNDDRWNFTCEAGSSQYIIGFSFGDEIDIEKNLELKSEYKTVKEFKNRIEDLGLGEYMSKKENLNKNENDPSNDLWVETSYYQEVSGDLKEEYGFRLKINRDKGIDTSKKYDYRDECINLEPSHKEMLATYMDYISNTIGIDISKYITVDQLYSYINEYISGYVLGMGNITGSVYSLPIGRLDVESFPEEDNIKIKIELPVIAEGKTRL